MHSLWPCLLPELLIAWDSRGRKDVNHSLGMHRALGETAVSRVCKTIGLSAVSLSWQGNRSVHVRSPNNSQDSKTVSSAIQRGRSTAMDLLHICLQCRPFSHTTGNCAPATLRHVADGKMSYVPRLQRHCASLELSFDSLRKFEKANDLLLPRGVN